MSDFKDALSEPASNAKGFGMMMLLDGIIILIVGIIDIFNKHHLGSIEAPAAGIIVIAMAVVLLIGGYLSIKEQKAGYYLAWIMAIVTLVYGAITTFGIIKGDMTFRIYFLLTGVIMLFYLIGSLVRSNKSEE